MSMFCLGLIAARCSEVHFCVRVCARVRACVGEWLGEYTHTHTHTHTPDRRRDRCFFCETPKRISDDRAARGKYCMYEGASMAIAGQTVAPRSDLHDEIERMLSHKSSK